MSATAADDPLSVRRWWLLVVVLMIGWTNYYGVRLLLSPVDAIPFSDVASEVEFRVTSAIRPAYTCFVNGSHLQITSFNSGDLDTYFTQCANEFPSGVYFAITFDFSFNQLTDLPTNLFSGSSTPSAQIVDLSYNAFTHNSVANFFLNSSDPTSTAVFALPPSSVLSTLDLSSNQQIGPQPPTMFQLIKALNFICQRCGLTSLPTDSFLSVNVGTLDLSYNDLSQSGSVSSQAFTGAQYSTIILNNCNLRTTSLPTSGLLHSSLQPQSGQIFTLSLANNPLSTTAATNLTAAAYLATMPNIFVDLPDGIFSQPTMGAGLYQSSILSITLGDFISYAGEEGLFGNFTLYPSGSIQTINLAPTVAIEALGGIVNYYCPAQQVARALTNCQIAQPGLTAETVIGAYGLTVTNPVPNVPQCTFPTITNTSCQIPSGSVLVSTEPALLQRPLYKFINSLYAIDKRKEISWTPPISNAWNPALNRSDWMPQDMLCDLTNFIYLALPALPYPQFSFPPPENMLGCLTSQVYNIDWRSANLVSSGLFGGRLANAPQINIAVDLLKLYEGDRPVPVDFFTPLLGNLQQGFLDNVRVGQPSVCSADDCPHALKWLNSHCPYIMNQTCLPCPDGYYPSSISSADYGTVYFCASSPPGSYVSPYTDASLFPLPVACQSGSYQQYQRQTSCTLCLPGTYNSLEGSSKPGDCLQCPPGTANPQVGGKNVTADCQPCPIGSASSSSGVARCSQCSPGYYQNQIGQFECEPCPINTYRDRTGGTSSDDCTPCPPQTPLSSAGSTSVLSCSTGTSCPDGYYTSILDSKPCQSLCAPGSYCQGGQITSCPPGSFSNTTGLSSCYACGPGWYSPVVGSTSDLQCLPCPLSTYSTGAISSSCQPCFAGSISTVAGSSSAELCEFTSACNLTSYQPLSDPNLVRADLTYCQLGSVTPMSLSQLLPDGITLMSAFAIQLQPQLEYLYQNPTLTPAAATRAYRRYTTSNQAPSLRLADYSTDDQLTLHGATQPSADINSIGSGVGGGSSLLTRSTTITILVIFLTVAFLSWPIYRRIPPNWAFHFDQFNMNHHIHAGQSPVKQPTQFGSAVTWSFLWISILTIIFLASASNTVTNTSLVPPSSIPYAGTARADFQITIRAYSSNSSVSMFCNTWLLNTDQDGFNNFTFRTRPNADVCSIAADCLDCDLGSGSSSVAFTFPYDTQFFEWELFISSAAPKTWSRRYGVLSQLPSHLFDSQSELQFSVIESYYTDHTQGGDGTRQSGFELDFAQYESVQPQPVATYSPESTVTIKFVLTKSDIMFDSYSTNKLSTFQLFVSILTAIVSLFTIFGIFFNKFERFILRLLCHQSSGELRKDAEGRIQLGHETSTNDVIKGSLSHTLNPVNSDSSVIGSNEVELEVNPAAGGVNSIDPHSADHEMAHAL